DAGRHRDETPAGGMTHDIARRRYTESPYPRVLRYTRRALLALIDLAFRVIPRYLRDGAGSRDPGDFCPRDHGEQPQEQTRGAFVEHGDVHQRDGLAECRCQTA